VREEGQIVLAEAAPGGFKGVATHRAFNKGVRANAALAGGLLLVRNVTDTLLALRA
jgi:hypothetical protein